VGMVNRLQYGTAGRVPHSPETRAFAGGVGSPGSIESGRMTGPARVRAEGGA